VEINPGFYQGKEAVMSDQRRQPQHLGDLISVCFAHFMDLYNDADLASVATAAVINDILQRQRDAPVPHPNSNGKDADWN